MYKRLREQYPIDDHIESIAIVSLLHDLYKTNFYKADKRNAKKNGQWVEIPIYTYDDKFPYGHGEKSVYLIQKHMQLTDEEAMAIRWHMGWSDGANPNTVSQAIAYNKLVLDLQHADQNATFLDEKSDENPV